MPSIGLRGTKKQQGTITKDGQVRSAGDAKQLTSAGRDHGPRWALRMTRATSIPGPCDGPTVVFLPCPSTTDCSEGQAAEATTSTPSRHRGRTPRQQSALSRRKRKRGTLTRPRFSLWAAAPGHGLRCGLPSWTGTASAARRHRPTPNSPPLWQPPSSETTTVLYHPHTASSIVHFDNPVMVPHGANDDNTSTPFSTGADVYQRAVSANQPAELHKILGGYHCPYDQVGSVCSFVSMKALYLPGEPCLPQVVPFRALFFP